MGLCICVWCGKVIRAGEPLQPISHGICLACAAEFDFYPLENLSSLPAEQIEELPFGYIELNEEDRVTVYNSTESALSGRDPQSVLGRNFFRDIAPCAGVKEFAGQLAELRRGKTDGRAEFKFVFTFSRGNVLVQIVMLYEAATGRAVLLVKQLQAEMGAELEPPCNETGGPHTVH